jgi:phosphoenolpyruvate carboxylase
MNANRKIPATMVTQHPDHANKPSWHTSAFLTTHDEAEEAYRSFAELGATEYKWDWEGKLVDENVVERLYGKYFDFFSKHPLGEERFLTFRLPNPRIQNEFRVGRAFINMATAAAVAKHFGFNVPPLFEVILPMTENAEEMIALQEAFVEVHALKHPLWRLDGFLTNIRIMPLFESVDSIINSDKILAKYLKLHRQTFHKQPPYMRPYVARSDPALNSGMLPTVLAIKLAFSKYKILSKEEGLPLYPAIGSGSLPFRGGLNPDSVEDFMAEYRGVRTTTIQSAFRFDYPEDKVKAAIARLESELPKHEAISISKEEEAKLLPIIAEGEKHYKKVIKGIAPLVNTVASNIPPRRERFQHTGLFGYSRGEGEIKLPRAIGFTCSMYSVGVPPEFIGTGRAIAFAKKHDTLPLLELHYRNIRKDLTNAGRFINKNNLKKLAKSDNVWQEILENVELVEEYLGNTFEPQDAVEKTHFKLTEAILNGINKKQTVTEYIVEAAQLRKSMG